MINELLRNNVTCNHFNAVVLFLLHYKKWDWTSSSECIILVLVHEDRQTKELTSKKSRLHTKMTMEEDAAVIFW